MERETGERMWLSIVTDLVGWSYSQAEGLHGLIMSKKSLEMKPWVALHLGSVAEVGGLLASEPWPLCSLGVPLHYCRARGEGGGGGKTKKRGDSSDVLSGYINWEGH